MKADMEQQDMPDGVVLDINNHIVETTMRTFSGLKAILSIPLALKKQVWPELHAD